MTVLENYCLNTVHDNKRQNMHADTDFIISPKLQLIDK